MTKEAEQAYIKAKELADLVNNMIPSAKDWDLQRLLKQIEADLMDVQHKLSMAVKLSSKE
jgi:cob(I)alamin adenosyltransferase